MAATNLPSLLAPFHGERPPAPAWFDAALAIAPERKRIVVEGAEIEMLTWGEVGAPGLLLLHGGMAHADWWSFVAPFFAQTHRVAALSWSGMGGSGWRESYSVDQYVTEMMTVMEKAGLMGSAVKPVVVAHSFGGLPTVRAARLHGGALGGVVIIDSPLMSPEQRARRQAERDDNSPPPRDTRIYASEAEALARFRFAPPQSCDNPFIVDWIARHSLRRTEGADGRQGWTWKFDPFMWSRLARNDDNEDLPAAACRVAVLWGELSPLFKSETIAHVRRTAPRGSLFVEIPQASHHVMADQPLAMVSATRAIIAAWG